MAEYILPTDLPISSPYGPRNGGFHPGVDFSDGIAGHPIHAVAAGTVTYKAYEDGGAGNTVTLTHADGTKSGYMHMEAPAIVNVGDVVTQGQTLGHVGTTGASTGPHLHLWMGSGPNPPGSFDPMTVLGTASPTTGDLFTMGQMDDLAQWENDTRAFVKKEIDAQTAELGGYENDTRAYVDKQIKASEERILAAIKAK